MHSAAAELNEEEHVKPPQPDRLDREEVDGQHAVRLRVQEPAPGETGALASRPENAFLRVLRTVVAETVTPRPCSSPTIR